MNTPKDITKKSGPNLMLLGMLAVLACVFLVIAVITG